MAETHVISALRAKRAEVSGYIHDLEKKVKRMRANLAHIDATIRVPAKNNIATISHAALSAIRAAPNSSATVSSQPPICLRRSFAISDSSHESSHRPIWSDAPNSRGILIFWESAGPLA